MRSRLVFSLFLIILLLSCKDDEENVVPDPGYNYFPLNVGEFRDFKFNSTRYFLRPDTNSSNLITDSVLRQFFIREICKSRFADLDGDSSYRFEIFTKSKIDEDWPLQPDSIAIVKIRNEELIYETNNRPFVKMIFPLRKGDSWNGNKFNALGIENYTVREYDIPLNLSDTVFENSILIEQSNISNLVEIDQRSEEYVYGLGLARKNTRILQFRQSNGQIGTDIEKGIVSTKEIIDYGSI